MQKVIRLTSVSHRKISVLCRDVTCAIYGCTVLPKHAELDLPLAQPRIRSILTDFTHPMTRQIRLTWLIHVTVEIPYNSRWLDQKRKKCTIPHLNLLLVTYLCKSSIFQWVHQCLLFATNHLCLNHQKMNWTCRCIFRFGNCSKNADNLCHVHWHQHLRILKYEG